MGSLKKTPSKKAEEVSPQKPGPTQESLRKQKSPPKSQAPHRSSPKRRGAVRAQPFCAAARSPRVSAEGRRCWAKGTSALRIGARLTRPPKYTHTAEGGGEAADGEEQPDGRAARRPSESSGP